MLLYSMSRKRPIHDYWKLDYIQHPAPAARRRAAD